MVKAKEMAQAIQDASQEEDRQKNIKEQLKAKLSELLAKQTRLSLLVSREEEYRDVEVRSFFNTEGKVEEVRMDTGEIFATRPPREDERQPRLLGKE